MEDVSSGPSPAPQRAPLRVVNPKDYAWENKLIYGKTQTGKRFVKPIVANAITILRCHPEWLGVLAFDAFGDCVVTLKPPPWDAMDAASRDLGDWKDSWTTLVQSWLQRRYSLSLGIQAIEGAVRAVADTCTVHPVRTYLDGLEWDQVPRIDTWLCDLLGAEDSPYVRAVGRTFLIAAVARIMLPGCKADTMLVLEGKQGTGKSTLLRKLVGDAWFVEISGKIDPVETPQLLRRKWLAEFAELASFKRTEQIEQIKSFLSRTFDNYRPPYGRRSVDVPRSTVFTGSTNEIEYLQDPTGARRFLPIRTTTIDLKKLGAVRDQLWAEAFQAFIEGHDWYITDQSVLDAATTEQSARFEDDVWAKLCSDYIGVRVKEGATILDIAVNCLQIEKGKISKYDQIRIGMILRRLGWAPHGKERPRRYYP